MPNSIEISLDNSKPIRSATSTSKEIEIVNFVQQLYQPNFVLQSATSSKLISVSSTSAANFGDILPFYPSQVQLIDFIVLTKESLISFLLNSRAFFVCSFSLFSQLINNIAYQTYLISIAGYDQIVSLPYQYNKLKNGLIGLIEIFASAQTREFWWLDFQIESRVRVERLLKSIKQSINILQKFYLAAFVSVCLISLFLVGQLDSNPKLVEASKSTLSKFITNQSLVVAQIHTNDLSDLEIVKLSSQSMSKESSGREEVNIILEHQVVEGDTIFKIANFYGLREDTIKFNNNLADGNLAIGSKLYIPWSDGYVYHAEDAVSPAYLSELYGASPENILEKNKNIYNFDKQYFGKGALILIPVTDFQKVAQANQQEEDRKENLRRAEEERKLQALYNSKNTYKGVTSSQAKSEGLIWPTTGKITQYAHPGHVALDIANPSEPPIFAVKDGVVRVGYEHGGYGNFVVIDHGNGLKTLYAHMSEVYVTNGQTVKQGVAIGRMGCVGLCTGTHLHFEVKYNNVNQDPLLYLP